MSEIIEERKKILRTAIEELRRVCEHVSNIYDQLRIKALTVMAGEVAIVSFMFAGEGVPIPEAAYGRIFYFAGVLLLSGAFLALLWTVSPLEWKIAYDLYSSDELKKFNTEVEFLEYLNNDHRTAVTHCMPLVGKRAKRFTWTIYALSLGVIILIVIKYGGQ